ncbi:unnamed protein product, partial [Brenthis ino]
MPGNVILSQLYFPGHIVGTLEAQRQKISMSCLFPSNMNMIQIQLKNKISKKYSLKTQFYCHHNSFTTEISVQIDAPTTVIFYRMLDISSVNSHLLYDIHREKVTERGIFIKELARTLVLQYNIIRRVLDERLSACLI